MRAALTAFLTRFNLLFLIFIFSLSATAGQKPLVKRPEVQQFIGQMVKKHDFNRESLEDIFKSAKIKPSIIKAISRPYESQPWYKYRKHFLTEDRIESGAKFWLNHEKTLARAEKTYGVPASMIVAIIGVESKYGKIQGKFRVIDALSTLAFAYPKRSAYFKRELEQFLVLCQEKGYNPKTVLGSYAGAIGQPQFMPSSYRAYAVDFSGNGKIDLRNTIDDVIGSVANYFHRHGWRSGEPIVTNAKVTQKDYQPFTTKKRVARFTLNQLEKNGIFPAQKEPNDLKASLLALRGEHAEEFYLGYNNFFVITRYNTSKLYALAAFELSQKISERYAKLKQHA